MSTKAYFYGWNRLRSLRPSQRLLQHQNHMKLNHNTLDTTELREKAMEVLQSLRKYQTPDNKKAILQIINSFGPFILLWAAMYKLWDVSTFAVIGLGVLNAFFLVRIFIIQHDCGHRSFMKSTAWRNITGYICSLVSFIPYGYWAKSHHFHHGHNGMLEVRDIGDINTLTVEEYRLLSPFKKLMYRVYRSPVVMFVIGPIYYVFIHSRLPLINLPDFKREKLGLYISNVVMLGLFVFLCMVLDWQKVLLTHAIVLGLFAVIAIWFFYIQHQHEEGYKHWKKNWDYMTAAIKGSSYYKLPKIMNWFTGNIAIHHIHHLNPSIPNYNLAKCVKENPWFDKYTTVITFWESLKMINHRLWDEHSQRMISFGEYGQMKRLGLV